MVLHHDIIKINMKVHPKTKLTRRFRNLCLLFNLKYSLSNLAINDIFKICRPSRFQTCPWLFHLIKNRMRYLRLKRMNKFPNRLVNFDFGCRVYQICHCYLSKSAQNHFFPYLYSLNFTDFSCRYQSSMFIIKNSPCKVGLIK